MMKIGQVVDELNLSADTLRYYEKINLITNIVRSTSGIRLYEEKDLIKLRFIRRAQKMGFTLSDISQLLVFRDNPAEFEIRTLALQKLKEIEEHMRELSTLHDELRELTEASPNILSLSSVP